VVAVLTTLLRYQENRVPRRPHLLASFAFALSSQCSGDFSPLCSSTLIARYGRIEFKVTQMDGGHGQARDNLAALELKPRAALHIGHGRSS
jgi:hypothetical protein